MEGLRRPGEALAHTMLAEMASVAKDYFFHLHTLEPSPREREDAQTDLLEETRLQGLLRPNPKPEDMITGPFTIDEMKAL